MNVLIITNTYPPHEIGGYGKTMFEFSSELHKRGYNISIVTSDYNNKIKKNENGIFRELKLFGNWDNGIPKINSENDINEINRFNKEKICSLISSFYPDIVIIGNMDFIGRGVLDVILHKKIPIIHRLGNNHLGFEWCDSMNSNLYHIAACSNYVIENLKRNRIPTKNYSILPPGADYKFFYNEIEYDFNIYPKICFSGHILEHKGSHLLIQALSFLKDENIEFSCELAGKIINLNYLNYLRNFIKTHKLENNIRFLGYLNKFQLRDMYKRNNIFVFPSDYDEPFGKVQIESQASGLPVIRSSVGGYADMMDDGVDGLLFEKGNSYNLYKKIKEILQNNELRNLIKENGQKRACGFSTEKCVDKLESIIKKLVSLI